MMVKKINYKVLQRDGELEIRAYGPIILATVKGRRDNSSFSKLFDYIQGNNLSREEISMTAPVISSSRKIPMTAPVISDGETFSFVLPENMELDQVPKPLDPEILIEMVPGRTLAVIKFSGRVTEGMESARYDQLLDMLKKKGIKSEGSPFLMRYNSPFMPGPFRRNEAAVEIVFKP